ncbi:hypothetical protein B0H15DRAFT_834622 [Mycena belliarum]|uniref:MYND-type domain-containing protein n=1 Tax=Mycena belliarum TaxID=1033014 RepID=A0AAD6XSC4_9AGAR|nr:hypothetical protein B0H15DRAFT_834622 [Mycena belliae]
MASSRQAATLFNQGQMLYDAGRVPEAFELYRRAIVMVLDRGNVLQKVPSAPAETAEEFLVIIWQNLLACFREPSARFTQESSPAAYELLYSFRPSAGSRAHPQFNRPQGKRVLKAMQIMAGGALGILAWNKGERATAAKRYQEALDVAATHPPFVTPAPGLKHLEKMMVFEVQELRTNLERLGLNDTVTARMAGQGPGRRKDVLDAPHTRVDPDAGEVLAHQSTFVVATDACGRSGCLNRGVNFKRCSACKKTPYCSVECQKADWKKHKTTH